MLTYAMHPYAMHPYAMHPYAMHLSHLTRGHNELVWVLRDGDDVVRMHRIEHLHTSAYVSIGQHKSA
jgi:hypothetical protein